MLHTLTLLECQHIFRCLKNGPRMKLFLVSSLGEKKLSRDQSWGSRKASLRRLQARDRFCRLPLSKNEKRWSRHSWLRSVRCIAKGAKHQTGLCILSWDLVCWYTQRISSCWESSLFCKAWIHDSFAAKLFLTHSSHEHIRSKGMGVILRRQQQAATAARQKWKCVKHSHTQGTRPSVGADVWTVIVSVPH